MASPIVSVPEPVSSLNVEIGVNPALYALYQTSHLIAPTRPGESPSAFTADLAGTPESTTPIEGNHPGVTSVFAPGVGRVLQIENTPLIVGARVPLPVIGARVYRITGFAQRIIGADARQENLDKAVRRRLIDRLVREERVEIYTTEDGTKAMRVKRSAASSQSPRSIPPPSSPALDH